MNDEERERQRVARLRQSQIRSRDPGPSKIRHYDWSKQKPKQRKPLLNEIFGVFPTRIRGLAFGLLVGIILAIIVQIVAPDWVILGVLLMLVATVVGYILGVVVQSQE